MKKRWLVMILLATGSVGAGENPLVPYPEGFREWRFLGSVVSHPKDRADAPSGLIHHIYANPKAVEGLRTGNYPEGAMLVADWFLLKEKYPGSVDEGARDRTDVMIRDARFVATEGWGYDQFAKDSKETRKIAGAAPNACFECHTKARKRGYVFSVLPP